MGDNIIYLSGKRPPLSLEDFKDRLFDMINEGDYFPVLDIRVFDRENKLEVTLSNQDIYEILVQKKEIT